MQPVVERKASPRATKKPTPAGSDFLQAGAQREREPKAPVEDNRRAPLRRGGRTRLQQALLGERIRRALADNEVIQHPTSTVARALFSRSVIARSAAEGSVFPEGC